MRPTLPLLFGLLFASTAWGQAAGVYAGKPQRAKAPLVSDTDGVVKWIARAKDPSVEAITRDRQPYWFFRTSPAIEIRLINEAKATDLFIERFEFTDGENVSTSDLGARITPDAPVTLRASHGEEVFPEHDERPFKVRFTATYRKGKVQRSFSGEVVIPKIYPRGIEESRPVERVSSREAMQRALSGGSFHAVEDYSASALRRQERSRAAKRKRVVARSRQKAKRAEERLEDRAHAERMAEMRRATVAHAFGKAQAMAEQVKANNAETARLVAEAKGKKRQQAARRPARQRHEQAKTSSRRQPARRQAARTTRKPARPPPKKASRRPERWPGGARTGVFGSAARCTRVELVHGSKCGKADSLLVRFKNDCGRPLQASYGLERVSGKISYGRNSNTTGGWKVGAYVCHTTGRWRLAVCWLGEDCGAFEVDTTIMGRVSKETWPNKHKAGAGVTDARSDAAPPAKGRVVVTAPRAAMAGAGTSERPARGSRGRAPAGRFGSGTLGRKCPPGYVMVGACPPGVVCAQRGRCRKKGSKPPLYKKKKKKPAPAPTAGAGAAAGALDANAIQGAWRRDDGMRINIHGVTKWDAGGSGSWLDKGRFWGQLVSDYRAATGGTLELGPNKFRNIKHKGGNRWNAEQRWYRGSGANVTTFWQACTLVMTDRNTFTVSGRKYMRE